MKKNNGSKYLKYLQIILQIFTNILQTLCIKWNTVTFLYHFISSILNCNSHLKDATHHRGTITCIAMYCSPSYIILTITIIMPTCESFEVYRLIYAMIGHCLPSKTYIHTVQFYSSVRWWYHGALDQCGCCKTLAHWHYNQIYCIYYYLTHNHI